MQSLHETEVSRRGASTPPVATPPMALSPDRILTTKEVATHFGLGTRFLEVARTRGDGPAFCRFGRSVRYRVRDINAWLDARSVTSTSEE